MLNKSTVCTFANSWKYEEKPIFSLSSLNYRSYNDKNTISRVS